MPLRQRVMSTRTPPTGFLRLSESIDLHAVDPGQIRVPVTVVAVAEDRLVPVADAYRAVRTPAAAQAQLRVLRSRYGHDAFLKETDAIARDPREALRGALAVRHERRLSPADARGARRHRSRHRATAR